MAYPYFWPIPTPNNTPPPAPTPTSANTELPPNVMRAPQAPPGFHYEYDGNHHYWILLAGNPVYGGAGYDYAKDRPVKPTAAPPPYDPLANLPKGPIPGVDLNLPGLSNNASMFGWMDESKGVGGGPMEVVLSQMDGAGNSQYDSDIKQTDIAVSLAAKLSDNVKEDIWGTFFYKILNIDPKMALKLEQFGSLSDIIAFLYNMSNGLTDIANQQGKKLGMSAAQIAQWATGLNKWKNMAVNQRYQAIADLLGHGTFSRQQEIFFLNWLYNSYWCNDDANYSWSIPDKIALYNSLAQTNITPFQRLPDFEMFNKLKTYQNAGKSLPFALGCSVAIIAITVKSIR
ncbi:MAG: hypothetical protein ABIN13_09860 [Mucilaginibacter sp.]